MVAAKSDPRILLTGDSGICQALGEMWRAHATVDVSFVRPSLLPLVWKLARRDVLVAILMAGSPRLLARLKAFRRPIVLLWAGTDVHDCLHRDELRRQLPVLRSPVTMHAAVAPHLVEELKVLGIAAELMPLTPPDLSLVSRPLPVRHQVLFYSAPGREEFYGTGHFLNLAREFPSVPFVAVGGGRLSGNATPNVTDAGKVSRDCLGEFYSASTVLFRPTVHDGLPKMALEALRYGLHVAGTVNIPGCSDGRTPAGACEAARTILGKPPALNAAAPDGLKEYDPSLWTKKELARLSSLIAASR